MPTAAIRMDDGQVVHNCGDCDVDVPMESGSVADRLYVTDTEAFDPVPETDFFAELLHILSLMLQAPYVLHVQSAPVEQSEHTSSYLNVFKKEPSTMVLASRTEDYQLLGGVLE